MGNHPLTSDLGLDICTSTAPPGQMEVNYVRDILPSDVAMLSTERGVKAPSLVRIRDSHHALARVLALGFTPTEASAITGYGPGRISVLQNDPTFQELISHYRAEVQSAHGDLADRMTTISLDMVADLQDRHETNPEKFSLGDLHDFIKLFADRTGHGPQTKQTNINIHVNMAEKLEAARKRRDGGGAAPRPFPREAVGEVELLPPIRRGVE